MAEANKKKEVREELVIEVFPLKYAWAYDIKLIYRDEEVVIPGVASILRQAVQGVSSETAPANPVRVSLPNTIEKLKGKGLAAREGTPPEPPPEARPEETKAMGREAGRDGPGGAGGLHPADTRQNAVVVRDTREKIPIYAKVIKALDVSAGLIEITAAIMDVNIENVQELGTGFNASSTP